MINIGIYRSVTTLVGVSLALASLGCAQGEGGAPQAGGMPAANARVANLQSSSVADTSSFVAQLKCRKSVVVRPRVDGYITQIFVRSGDIVKAGSRLMEVDPSKEKEALKSQLAGLETNFAEKRNSEETLRSLKENRGARISNLEYSKSQYDRYLKLKTEGAVAQESVDQYLNQYKQAQSELAALDAQIRAQEATISRVEKVLKQLESQTNQERVQLAYHTVSAPFDGIVGDVPVKLGQFVETSTNLTTVDQSRPLEVYVYVPAEQATKLRVDMRLQLFDSDGRDLGACPIFFISPQVNDQNQTVLVKALFDNNAQKLRSNQQVTTKIVFGHRDRLLVPTNSVVHISGQDFVFIAESTDKGSVAKQKPVKLNGIQNNAYVVESGLTGQEKVIVSDVQNLFEGAPLALK